MELSRPVVVYCRDHLPICPIWVCPWAKNLSNQAALGPDIGRPISPKPFDTIWSSVELSRSVVVQHHGHLTLTLDFQGQILKMLYLSNGRGDWHGMKGMWVDTMLDPHYDCKLWRSIDLEWKRCELDAMLDIHTGDPLHSRAMGAQLCDQWGTAVCKSPAV